MSGYRTGLLRALIIDRWSRLALAGALAAAVLAPSWAHAGTRVATVNHGSGDMAIGFPHQRKVLRDASGYWYAVWMDDNGAGTCSPTASSPCYEIFMSRSTNTTGTAWSTPVELAGDSGIIYTEAAHSLRYPAIEIDRANGILHLAFVRVDSYGGNLNDLVYSRCTDLANWNDAGSWYEVDGATGGYDTVVTDQYVGSNAAYAHSMSLDSSGDVHLAYTSASGQAPYYVYGPTTGWGAAVLVDSYYGSTQAYPTIEVDSSDVAHFMWTQGSTYRGVYHRSTSDFATFTPDPAVAANGIVFNSTATLRYLSAAADDEGNVQVSVENDATGAVWGAHYDGAVWTEIENVDTLGWDKPAVGARMGAGVTDDVILAPRNTADPDDIYYWTWDGSAWGPYDRTVEVTDSFVSLEKQAPGTESDMGFLFFDAGAGTGDIYFSRVRFDNTQASFTPGASSDDATERASDGFMWLPDVYVRIRTDPAPANQRHSGIRFTNVTVPPGATITSARFYGYVRDTTDDNIDTVVYGEANTNPGTFTTTAGDISGRTPTGNSVTWQQTNMGAGWESIDVADIVQEIVDTGGWASGNPLALLFLTPGGAAATNTTFHSYDYVVDTTLHPYLEVTYSMVGATLQEHSSGQLTDQLVPEATQNNVPLFRFRLTNERPVGTTVDQIVFDLSAVSAGIAGTDLGGLRIHDGTSDVVTGGTASITAPTGTVTFLNDWTLPAGPSTKEYTLYGNLTNLSPDETLTVGLATTGITLTPSGLTVEGLAPTSATHLVDHYADVGQYSTGQACNQFVGAASYNDMAFFRFSLTNNSLSVATVDQVVFPLSAIAGITQAELTDFNIYAGAALQAAAGTVSVTGATGSITFSDLASGLFTIPALTTVDYMLTGDVAGLVPGDTISLELDPSNVTLDSQTVGGVAARPATHAMARGALPLIAYSRDGNPDIGYSNYQDGDWPAGAQAVAQADRFLWKVAKMRPDFKEEVVLAVEENATDPHLWVSFWDRVHWDGSDATPFNDALDLGPARWDDTRTFGAAYESASGELLIVAGHPTKPGYIKFWAWDGCTWVEGEDYLLYSNDSDVRWINMASQPGTNQIAMIVATEPWGTGPTRYDVLCYIWDGDTNSWVDAAAKQLTPSGNVATDSIAVEYRRTGTYAGYALFAHGLGDWVNGHEWNGSDWEPLPYNRYTGNLVTWIRLEADPASDDLLMAWEHDDGTNPDAGTIFWRGTANGWQDYFEHETEGTLAAATNRIVDVVYESINGHQGHALVVYSDGLNTVDANVGLSYQHWDGTAWSAEQNITSDEAYWVQVERAKDGLIHLAAHDDSDTLRTWVWDGTSWTAKTSITTGLETGDANHAYETFALTTMPADADPTAVRLVAFDALPRDGTVDLEWWTGSELDNLGFHLYRSREEGGPWTRLTSTLIPGLGSSPEGARYSWQDTGLQNGTRYYYRLEDIDAASRSTSHGPVSAVPHPPDAPGSEGGSGEEPEPSAPRTESPPPAESPTPEPSPECETCPRVYGDPEATKLRIVSRTDARLVVELETRGFVATPEPEGMQLTVPGFDEPTDPAAAALPFRRAVLDGVVGKRARVVSVEAEGVLSWPDLRPAAVGEAGMEVGAGGAAVPVRRRQPLPAGREGFRPARMVRLAGDAFIGETKKIALELYPLRWNATAEELVLTRTLRVTLAFDSAAPRETGGGSIGRRYPRSPGPEVPPYVHLHTSQRGLHAVSFEAAFPGSARALPTSVLRLRQRGRVVPFHVEPSTDTFGPGSVLFFHADVVASSTDYSGEVTWALERATDGVPMAVASAAPSGPDVTLAPYGEGGGEANRIYVAGLLAANDIWLWENLNGGVTKTVGFAVEGVLAASSLPARIRVFLEGGSDSDTTGEHHVSVSLNGTSLGDTFFDGKRPHVFEEPFDVALLNEGANTLTLTNVGDTGVYSLIYFDRLEVVYPQASALRSGRFEGAWTQTGTAEVDGAASVVVDVTDPAAPVWLTSAEAGPGSVRLHAEADHRYVVADPAGLHRPRVSRPLPTTLRAPENQADYILVAPSAFMEAATPLLERRRDQGLTTFAASLEEIATSFGQGEASAEAIRAFLAFAYHGWQSPSPRYVLLLGDSSYDPRNFTGTSVGAPLPAQWVRTSYMWTASDPTLAAVNGEDLFPDLALGRLPAMTVEEAESMVRKVLDWEDSGQDLGGAAALVADRPDPDAGDFEADIDDIARSFLAARNPQSILVRELGSSTRPAIKDAFNGGLSLLSYVGHGAAAIWGTNVLNSWDAGDLLDQSQQPLMLTLDCMNGYFVAPNYDALGEAFLKVPGRGTIASFSPTGLSLDGPAHAFHRALMAEITGGGHQRLGDVVLAAQTAYASEGQMPELLAIYHLFGDPAMRIAP